MLQGCFVGFSGFPLSTKTRYFLNSNQISETVDEEPLCGYVVTANCHSFICLLFSIIYLSELSILVHDFKEFCPHTALAVKPWLHKQLFACDGDAFFFNLLCRQREVKIACVAIFV